MVCNEINGIEIESNSKVTGLTNFVNEACSDLVHAGARPVRLKEFSNDTLNVTDINAFFQRPRKIATGTYPGNSMVPLFRDYVDILMETRWALDKLEGTFGWRGTMCFKLVVTATPFQAGILRLGYNCDEDIPELRNLHPMPFSILPGVDLDISKATSVVLKVPYISSFNFHLTDPTQKELGGSLGRLAVFPMTPSYVAPSGTAPTFSLWGWVEDLELIGGATTDYVEQSGKFERKLDTSSRESSNIPGNVSNVLAAGSNLVTYLGRKIPMISSFAGTASWALRESAKIAASYGWSKPLDARSSRKAWFTDNISQINSDTAFTGYNMGVFSDNSVVPSPGFAGTDFDEMALDYILGISCVIARPTYSKSDVVGKTIYACALSPYAMKWNEGNRNNTNMPADQWAPFWVSPVCGTSYCFGMYRGGFKFRLKMAKTGFHTGRLLVGYNPSNKQGYGGNRIPNTRDFSDPLGTPVPFKSVIWDLRDDSVLDFECPFQSPQSYLGCGDMYGDFFIQVLDPLESPETVSDVIMMLVEVSALPGFEFAVPKTPGVALNPYVSTPAALNDVEAQAGTFEPTVETGNDNASSLCIGERILSIKQLLLRSVPYGILKGGSSMTVNNYCTRPIKKPGNGIYEGDIRDYINWFGSAYAKKRGGINISAISMANNVTLTAGKFVNDYDAFDMAPLVIEKRGALHVKVPYYNSLSRAPCTTHGLAAETGFCDTTIFSAGKDTDPPTVVFRSAADDFQFGGFIGYPQMVFVSGGYSTNSLNLKKVLLGQDLT